MQQIKLADSLIHNLFSKQRQVDSTKNGSLWCKWISNTIEKVVELTKLGIISKLPAPRRRGQTSHFWTVVLEVASP